MAGAVRARTTLAVLVALASAGAEHAFRITSLSVPEYVEPARDAAGGAGVEVECTYDADFTVLKWWKGRQEFFRYTPGAAPSTRTFPALGVGSVRALACGPTACRLRLDELTEEASGAYRCDIERERPPYKFAASTGHMRVRGLGATARRPTLSGLRDQYAAGEEIRARCDAAPDSHLRWYVNGQEVARGSPELRLEATRLLFLGARAEAAVQCAEFSAGRLLGSSTARARWRDSRAPTAAGAAGAEHPQPEEQRTGGASAPAPATAAALAVVSFGVRSLAM